MPIRVFTDGSSNNKTGLGGWGWHFTFAGVSQEGYGGAENTTNNRMELRAMIEGAKAALAAAPDQEIIIFSDSQYVVKGTTEWMFGWKARNWRKADGKPVLNQDIWEEVLAFIGQNLNVRLQWVKGHAGHPENEYADQLAEKGRLTVTAGK